MAGLATPSETRSVNGNSSDVFLSLRNVSKRYGGVAALENVSFDVRRSETHAVMGENGAGKSTLVKILAGAVQRDAGQIVLGGRETEISSPAEAHRLGISIVYQETMLAENLTVAENIFLGHDDFRFLLPARTLEAKTAQVLDRLGVSVRPSDSVAGLTVGQKQLVQIARALVFSAQLLILDEPTASLSDHESQHLLEILHELTRRGITLIYVSHKLPEVRELATQATVLRDGRHVETVDAQSTPADRYIRLMVGRDVEPTKYEVGESPGEKMLEVESLESPKFKDISFDVRSGEIVGCFGLVGSGRTDVARAIFGIDDYVNGSVRLLGEPLPDGNPEESLRRGLAFLPEDRKGEGLVMGMATGSNVSLSSLDRLSSYGVLSSARERPVICGTIKQLDIRCSGPEQAAGELSGGNQQKVVLGKCLATQPKVLILDEPTKGIDVGAKAEFHELMRRQAHQGLAVLLISSELPEVQSLSDRILVFCEGRIVKDFRHGEADDSRVMTFAAGAE